MKHYYQGKTAWITGASSGLGEALALQLAPMGCSLVLSARSREKLLLLREVCLQKGAPDCHIIDFDLSMPNAVDKALHTFKVLEVPLHFLFCNGGVSQRALAHEAQLSTDYTIMETNYFSHVRMCKALMPDMIAQRFGHIVITSSITGKFGFPLRSAYSASKHALHGFFESVQTEHYKGHLRVTIACPGRVRTNISLGAVDAKGDAHARMDEGQAGGISAEQCARKMLQATALGKREVWIGGKEVLMVWFRLYLPALFFKIASKIKPT
jgi:short-subunit dehydrogenase